ncbi:MAG: SDR family oxidoreductase [Chloroflexi bacterium]|nr:SDR family oxidoreductase [Chloroflexota bacterium]
MDLKLKDKVVVITGAGQGIGKATALTFVEEGARVVIADVDQQRAKRVADEIQGSGGTALALKIDVTKWEDAHGMVKSTIEQFGQLDILVNNAGLWRTNRFAESQRDDWNAEISVTYLGVLNCTRAVLDHMLSRQAGVIISLGSDAARVGGVVQPVYSGAKGAVISFTKALAKDVSRYGIRVNVVSPGATNVERRVEEEARVRAEGDLAKIKAYEDRMAKLLRAYPTGRLASPQDIANMIVFLASERADDVTGQTISVNGGYCMI